MLSERQILPKIKRVILSALLAGIFGSPTQSSSKTQEEYIRIRFIAASVQLRETFGYNKDSYLAETFPNGAEPRLILAVDEYLNAAPPLSRESLTAPNGVVLRVRRNLQCDRLFSEIKLRAAPGDPISSLPIPLHYTPQLNAMSNANMNVPCYSIVRRKGDVEIMQR